MILDYAKADLRWKRLWAKVRKPVIIVGILLAMGALVEAVNDCMTTIRLVNYEQRLYRDERRVFGILLSRHEYALPGHPAIRGLVGTWHVFGVTSHGGCEYLTQGRINSSLRMCLTALEISTVLPANQKKALEDQAWASAIAQDEKKMMVICEIALPDTLISAASQPVSLPVSSTQGTPVGMP